MASTGHSLIHTITVMPASARPANPTQPPAPGRPALVAPEPHPTARHVAGFWAVAVAFLLNGAFAAVPTPLYVIYQQRDHLSNLVVTVVFAVYALGVIASLFLAGHLSDWAGRRPVLVCALLINVVSALIFIVFPVLPGLIVARIVTGVSVGLATPTATAYVTELHARTWPGAPGRRGQLVANVANLGGISIGPLVAGLLAAWAPDPLRLSYIVVGGALAVLTVLVAMTPETVHPPAARPAWRPQRVVVPAPARRRFFAAAAAALASFTVLGMVSSLVPTFLLGTIHVPSHAVAGAAAFAVIAGSATAQLAAGRIGDAVVLRASVPILVIGFVLFAAGIWLPDLAVFLVGGATAGTGTGLLFRGALAAGSGTAPADSRAEVLAGLFLAAYIGVIPVIGLGLATTYLPVLGVVLTFAAVIAAAATLAVHVLMRASEPETPVSQH
jgi:predicted MFS family arabinose efflux permease